MELDSGRRGRGRGNGEGVCRGFGSGLGGIGARNAGDLGFLRVRSGGASITQDLNTERLPNGSYDGIFYKRDEKSKEISRLSEKGAMVEASDMEGVEMENSEEGIERSKLRSTSAI